MNVRIWRRDVGCRWIVFLSVWIGAAGGLKARVIDDFNLGPYFLVGANATVNQTQTGLNPDHVLGGSRFISFRSFTIPPSTLTVAGAAGTLSVTPGGCCTYLTMRYGDTSNPLNVNLRDDGNDRFVVTFAGLTSDISLSLPSIGVIDNQGHFANILSQFAVQPVAPFSMTIPYSQFTNIDWTNIRSIEIAVSRYGGGTGGPGKSFSLDSIVTVPEPAGFSLSVIAAAVSALPIARHRRIGKAG